MKNSSLSNQSQEIVGISSKLLWENTIRINFRKTVSQNFETEILDLKKYFNILHL